jgi:hypothetical protein
MSGKDFLSLVVANSNMCCEKTYQWVKPFATLILTLSTLHLMRLSALGLPVQPIDATHALNRSAVFEIPVSCVAVQVFGVNGNNEPSPVFYQYNCFLYSPLSG